MRYEDTSFLQDLKDYLVYDITKVIIYVNNKIEYICYDFDRIFDILQYIDYDKLNISMSMFNDVALTLYFKKEEGEENE